MKLSDISDYPTRLCVEMLWWCALSSKQAETLTSGELKETLAKLFTAEQMEAAERILRGEHPASPRPALED